MSNYASIENLLDDDNIDEESTQGKLIKKQKEIKIKEIEEKTKKTAQQIDIDYVDLFGFPINPEAISLISKEDALNLKTVCFLYDGKRISLGTKNTKLEKSIKILEKLNKQYFTTGKIYLISQHSFDYALETYDKIPQIKRYDKGVEIKAEDLEKYKKELSNYKKLNEIINNVNISDVITLILATGLKVSSSDIHIEAEVSGVAVRFRIDGVLQEAAVIDSVRWKKIISRLKLLAKVKINIENKPQDGRFNIVMPDEKIDVRSSFLPTAYGESVVLRILRSSSAQMSFDDLGLREESYEILKREIKKPNGLILTTGPTGSGKTTTLYAILNKLNTPNTKIITLEDPIEYQLEGINQSQVNKKAGFTFANGLRSILRQDPNIVMVGEIRDLETAEISVQASLTGHLVLSTLHTNDASGVIPRLTDMGVKPYFLIPSINAVVGQRLVRKLCPHCRKEHILNENEEEQVKKILSVISPKANVDIPSQLTKIYKASDEGCNKCNFTGYKGRIGIYEIFLMNEKIKELTMSSAPAFKILQEAIQSGMLTMLQDGILKCLEGVTSLDEIYRVSGDIDYINELYDIVISQTVGRGIKIKEDEEAIAKDINTDLSTINDKFENINTDKILNIIMALSLQAKAGDVHIEPTDKNVKIRFRIDGVLHDIIDLPKDHYLPLLSEIKILMGVPTNEKKATIDGRFTIYMPNKERSDCRVSVISGGYGETIVIRLLSSQATSLEVKDLGIIKHSTLPLNNALKKTKGIILTTGPTGSGKTTTLYAILNKLNTPDVKIITVEDPIEYQLPGLMQTQIDTQKGYTFAAAMRSLLRQNPNIMMIGEIRDKETADIAVEAALTGHLVLSTLHANSAAGAISRLSGLGVSKQLLSSSMECSIGQRLVRKICEHCKQEVEPTPEEKERINQILKTMPNMEKFGLTNNLKFYKGKGCNKCNNLGYKGRVGIYEIMEINPEIKKLIQSSDVIDYEIEQLAIKNGTVTMLQDGLIKASLGMTSLEEIFRVL